MLNYKYLCFDLKQPPFPFPPGLPAGRQGGKALCSAPSPVGESLPRFGGGWEGGKNYINYYYFIPVSRYSYQIKTLLFIFHRFSATY